MDMDVIMNSFGGNWVFPILSVIFFSYFVYSVIKDYQFKKVLFNRKAQLEDELKKLDIKYEAQLRDLEMQKKKLEEIVKKGR
jgi:hypothetical protein